ncbi:FecR family protein, partial [Xylella fastidiosa subsp. multiplex]|nr:FecR family protein [Xylella fastidiosa subsp. multiplex]
RIRISGVFNVDNPQAFLDLLPAIAPVHVQTAANGVVTILGR